jgi:predicted glycosyltransferase
MIIDAVRRIRPAVVVVELFPFGRRAVADEILAMLEAARGLPGTPPLVACSLRDILVGRGDEQPAFDEWACGLANAHFDAILTHSDPSFARLEESFRPRTPLRVPVLYTGFVAKAAPTPLPRDQRARRVVVSAGGGRVGEALLRAAIDAQPDLWRRERIAMRLIAGPFLAMKSWRELRSRAQGREGLELRRAVADLGLELRNALVSVSQCGYNTAIDILQAGVPALVVPFTAPGEDEQTRRARRLAARGAVRVLEPSELAGPALVREISELARATTPALDLDLNGARASADALSKMLAAPTANRRASA